MTTIQDKLLADLPGGFFKLSPEETFTHLDPRLREKLGIEEKASWLRVCFDPSRGKQLLERCRAAPGQVLQADLLVCRRDKDAQGKTVYRPFWARVYIQALTDAQGNFTGWKGYLLDRTAEEVRRRVDELPVGFYVMRRDPHGKERLIYASPAFAKLYGFDEPDEILGINNRKLFLSEANYQTFLKHLRERTQDDRRGTLVGWKNEVRAADGQTRFVTADMTWRANAKGVQERWGVLRDVSQDEFFSSHVHDYAVVQHTYSTALIGARHALDALRTIMEPDPFAQYSRMPSPAEIDAILQRYHEGLVRALEALLQQAQERNVHDEILQRFAEYLERLEEIKDLEQVWRLPTYLELGGRVLRHIQTLRSKRPPAPQPWFSREVLRQARVAAWDLTRIAALVLIRQSESHLLEVDEEIRLFRDFWTQPLRPRQYAEVDLTRILEESMLNLDAFARQRGVRWRRYGTWPEKAPMRGDPRSLQRAFSHLLHNAIKYSWQRAKGTWIGVRLVAYEEEGQPGWLVEIENYGVPIAPDEAEAIFQFGYRGRLSQDRARVGTGIGLYDAKQVFEEIHKGSLQLHSRPASGSEADIPDALGRLRPHLTTARVWLPRL